MNEKRYWIVNKIESKALLTCPECVEWYEIPNSVAEMKCYRHCPWCGIPLFLKEEDRNRAE